MKQTIYSMAVLNPINFPDEIEIQYVPLDPVTQNRSGDQVYTLPQRRSWEWIRRHWPLADPAYFDECEGYLRQGLRANLARGEHSIIVEDAPTN